MDGAEDGGYPLAGLGGIELEGEGPFSFEDFGYFYGTPPLCAFWGAVYILALVGLRSWGAGG